MPEVIEHGQTGFIVDSVDEAIWTVRRLGSLDRRRIRAQFELRFSATAMARRYLALYEQAVVPADTETDIPLLQTA